MRGTALVFEGFHRVDVPDDASLHAANLTLEHWVRFDEETTSRRELFRKTVGSWESFDVYYENNALFFRAGNVGLGTAMAIPFTPEVGRWYHLAVTFDDDNDVYAIYVDGNQAQSATTELSLGYDASWIRIGGRDNDAFLRGAMDEIRIWSVARSEEQIRDDMRRALQGDEDGLVAYYPADEGHGTILHDQSGHGNDGLMGEPNSFPPRWETSFGLGRTEPVTVRVRDVWGAVTEQVFDVTVSADVPASVQGIVFDDQNADGVFQVDTESGLGGREIFVDRNQNGVREPDEPAAITDDTGSYSITDLVPGDHRVTLLGQVGWRPTAPAEGVIDISVSAGQAAMIDFGSTQQDVTAADRSPAFVSSAPDAAEVGDLYRYAPVVSNPDGRPVTFDLSVAPPGMAVDPVTGVVGWIPAASQTGSQLVLLRVRDDRGLVDIQDFTIDVAAANTPPVFVTQPPEGPAAVGLPFTYPARALDADGDVLAYAMVTAPTGAALIRKPVLLSWTPAADQTGRAHHHHRRPLTAAVAKTFRRLH